MQKQTDLKFWQLGTYAFALAALIISVAVPMIGDSTGSLTASSVSGGAQLLISTDHKTAKSNDLDSTKSSKKATQPTTNKKTTEPLPAPQVAGLRAPDENGNGSQSITPQVRFDDPPQLSKYLNQSLNFINSRRSTNLEIDNVLNRFAQRQAQLMADTCTLTHQDLGRIQGLSDATGRTISAVAENVAYHSDNLAGALESLWNSRDHKKNMLDPYNRIGIGVVVSSSSGCKGYIYTAQVFAKS